MVLNDTVINKTVMRNKKKKVNKHGDIDSVSHEFKGTAQVACPCSSKPAVGQVYSCVWDFGSRPHGLSLAPWMAWTLYTQCREGLSVAM